MTSRAPEGVTIVVPAFNEAGAIAQTLATLKSVVPRLGAPAEIIVVDDGSTDGTAEAARAAGVKVLSHPLNQGYGRSLTTGIRAAAHETVAIVDADGTYPVDLLPELFAFYNKGFDMAVAARQGKYYEGSFGRRILRTFFRLLAEYTCGRTVPDINSGFRIFRREPVLLQRSPLSSGFSFTTTLTFLFMLNHLFVGYMPVPYKERVGKSKVRLFRDALRSLQIIVTIIAQYNPLKLYLILFAVHVLATGALALSLRRVEPWYVLVATAGWLGVVAIGNSAIRSLAPLKPKDAPASPPRLP